jgi:hypothetical protein
VRPKPSSGLLKSGRSAPQIKADGWEDATHYLVVRGPAESDPNLIIVPGLVPLVDKQTGEIEYVVAHAEWDRLDAMRPV